METCCADDGSIAWKPHDSGPGSIGVTVSQDVDVDHDGDAPEEAPEPTKAYCACLHVEYDPEFVTGGKLRARWWCKSCGTEFRRELLSSPEKAPRDLVEDTAERLLQSLFLQAKYAGNTTGDIAAEHALATERLASAYAALLEARIVSTCGGGS